MKKLSAFCIILLFLFSACKKKSAVGANGVEFTSPLQYNDFIISKQKSVVQDMSKYGQAAQVNADSAEVLLDSAVAHIDLHLHDLKGMPPFDGDSSFRDAAVELFTFYRKSFSTDFKEMLDINRKVEKDQMDESDIARYKQLEENVGKKESPLDAKLKDMQTQFAKANKLELSDLSVQKEIDKLK